MEARKIRDAVEARACLAEAASSGRTRRAWAREHGVDARSLKAWHVNLQRGSRSTPRLVELVSAASPSPPATYRIRCGAFEVETTATFDEASLGRLLRVVAAC